MDLRTTCLNFFVFFADSDSLVNGEVLNGLRTAAGKHAGIAALSSVRDAQIDAPSQNIAQTSVAALPIPQGLLEFLINNLKRAIVNPTSSRPAITDPTVSTGAVAPIQSVGPLSPANMVGQQQSSSTANSVIVENVPSQIMSVVPRLVNQQVSRGPANGVYGNTVLANQNASNYTPPQNLVDIRGLPQNQSPLDRWVHFMFV